MAAAAVPHHERRSRRIWGRQETSSLFQLRLIMPWSDFSVLIPAAYLHEHGGWSRQPFDLGVWSAKAKFWSILIDCQNERPWSTHKMRESSHVHCICYWSSGLWRATFQEWPVNSYGKSTTASAFPLDKRSSQLSWVFLNALSDNIPTFNSRTKRESRLSHLSLTARNFGSLKCVSSDQTY